MKENKNLLSALLQLLRPQIEELIIYVCVAICLIGVSLYQLATDGSIGTDSQDLTSAVRDIVGNAVAYVSSGDIWAKILLFGFWFIVGTVAYFLVWFLINLAVDTYNDVRISASFVHPRSFHQSDFWVSIIGRLLLRTMAGIALTFYVVFWAWVYTPTAIQAATNIIHMQSIAMNGLYFVGSLVLSLHIGMILVRLTFLKSDLLTTH